MNSNSSIETRTSETHSDLSRRREETLTLPKVNESRDLDCDWSCRRFGFALCALISWAGLTLQSSAQPSAFTYQGRLNDGANPASGIYDLRFTIYDAATGGATRSTTVDSADVAVTNGLFTVTLDFDSAPFTGADRWLDIAVRPGASTGAFATLTPRQRIASTPYAIRAANLTGALPASQLPANVALLDRTQSFTATQTFLNGARFGGRVGIGTATPQQSLHVAGNYLRVDGFGDEQATLGGDGAGGDVELGSSNPGVQAVALYNQAVGDYMSLFAKAAFFSGVVSGDGSGLTSLPAGELTGSLPDARLSANVALRAGGNTFTGDQTITGNVIASSGSTEAFEVRGAAAGYALYDRTTGAAGRWSMYALGGNLRFYGNGADRMALNASGQLGLGTLPTYSLDVRASQSVGRFTTTGNPFGAVLILNNTSATSDYLGAINFENNGSTVGQIGYLANDRITFRAGGQERMSLQAGLLTVNGVGNEQAYLAGGGGVVQMGSLNTNVTTIRFANLTGFPNPLMDCFAKTFQGQSDRHAKQDFKPVEATSILEKVVALPITEWAYKGDTTTRHIGPVSQDFKEAFGLGSSDKSIATVDADGVALAAIQGLNQKLESENTALKQRLERLERLLEKLVKE